MSITLYQVGAKGIPLVRVAQFRHILEKERLATCFFETPIDNVENLIFLQCSAMAGESDCRLHGVEGVSSGTLVGVPADGRHCRCASRGRQASVLATVLVS